VFGVCDVTLAMSLGQLRTAVPGGVVTAEDPDYDAARVMWNADVERYPAAVVRCASAAEVVTSLGVAREAGLRVTVRGGGHGSSGAALGDGSLVIDLSRMRGVTVDPVARTARVGGGALLADLDEATAAHGLAVPTGAVSHTGLGGITLGGGMGWLSRLYGLTVDNLLGAEIVTADGLVRRIGPDSDPDLFWAIRGGGAGFGVVTSFDLALHPIPEQVDLGLFFFGAERGVDALRLAREVMTDLPPRLNLFTIAMHAPPEPFVPEQYRFTPGWALMLTGFGAAEAHQAVAARLGAAEPLFSMVTPLPYPALQKVIDEGPSAPGVHSYDKGCFLELPLSHEAIRTLASGVAARGPLSLTVMYMLDGAYTAVADEATAFGGDRTPRLSVFVIGTSPDAAGLDAERRWVRELYAALEPLALDGRYLNSVADPDDRDRAAAYGTKLDRLDMIRAAYDPEGLFARP
jgi:hypothetical protein